MVKPIDIPVCKICFAKYTQWKDDGERLAALAEDLNLVPRTSLTDAATDLLEACKTVLGILDGNIPIATVNIETKLYKAIKKAEGSQ